MGRKAIFIAATGQHVGKTTVCLGLLAALKKKFGEVGFMKPLGQEHVEVSPGVRVDKDVILFHEYFDLDLPYEDMSPLIVPSGFTRASLDGELDANQFKENLLSSFHHIYEKNAFTIVEGTGHVGVGSILGLNNAQVAKLLDLEIILIAKGGLGSAFDELALNKSLCDLHGAKIRGVILNRVFPEKKAMVEHYMKKALERWDIPLIGCIPFNKLLSVPSMEDFCNLFKTSFIAGEKYSQLHFETIRLAASSVETFKELFISEQLIVTPANRQDILSTLVEKTFANQTPDFGLILTGPHPPHISILDRLQHKEIPTLYTPKNSFEAMRLINSFTAKIRLNDTLKIQKAIDLVEKHVDSSHFLN